MRSAECRAQSAECRVMEDFLTAFENPHFIIKYFCVAKISLTQHSALSTLHFYLSPNFSAAASIASLSLSWEKMTSRRQMMPPRSRTVYAARLTAGRISGSAKI